jgi:hypothetical protein
MAQRYSGRITRAIKDMVVNTLFIIITSWNLSGLKALPRENLSTCKFIDTFMVSNICAWIFLVGYQWNTSMESTPRIMSEKFFSCAEALFFILQHRIG